MKRMKLLRINTTILFLIGFFASTFVFAQEDELTIVGNRESVPDELNMRQLKSVLRGEMLKWSDGVSIKIALMKTSTPVGTSTCKKVYGMSGNELNKYFLALVFQGKAKAPTFFNSIAELESYVAQTPGAIGVSQNTVEGSLKIVLVDGKKQM